MKKNKKIMWGIIVSLSVVTVISLLMFLSACGSKITFFTAETPYKEFISNIAQSVIPKNTLNNNLSGNKIVSQIGFSLDKAVIEGFDLGENIYKINAESKSDFENNKFNLNFDLSVKGQSVSLNTYFDNDNCVLMVEDLLDKPIKINEIFDVEQFENENNIDFNILLEAIQNVLSDSSLIFDECFLNKEVSEELVNVELDGKSVKATKLQMNISNEELKVFFEKIINKLIENEKFNIFFDMYLEQYNLSMPESDKITKDKALSELKDSINEILDEKFNIIWSRTIFKKKVIEENVEIIDDDTAQKFNYVFKYSGSDKKASGLLDLKYTDENSETYDIITLKYEKADSKYEIEIMSEDGFKITINTEAENDDVISANIKIPDSYGETVNFKVTGRSEKSDSRNNEVKYNININATGVDVDFSFNLKTEIKDELSFDNYDVDCYEYKGDESDAELDKMIQDKLTEKFPDIYGNYGIGDDYLNDGYYDYNDDFDNEDYYYKYQEFPSEFYEDNKSA